ncbi:MAG: sucrase ferredoxin [Actinobacteria bacterium]|nr:sucrase ferredoxin [Actinomycetota bacterium]
MTQTCSDIAVSLDESLAATAPFAQAWLVIEVPGSWGRQAVSESGLPDGLGATLLDRAHSSGTTVIVARRPGKSADVDPATRRVWLAHTTPGGVRMRVADIADPRVLLDLDLAAMARGVGQGLGERSTELALFLCANAKRDACCARLGGGIARNLAASPSRDAVWESSHLGGHRFAATALLLPFGTVFGRLDLESAQSVLDDAQRGQLSLPHYRGRSAFPRWHQAAEIAVREAESITGIDSLDVLRVSSAGVVAWLAGIPPEPAEPTVETEVRCVDGRAWRVTVARSARLPERSESCTGENVPGTLWNVVSVTPTTPWRP